MTNWRPSQQTTAITIFAQSYTENSTARILIEERLYRWRRRHMVKKVKKSHGRPTWLSTQVVLLVYRCSDSWQADQGFNACRTTGCHGLLKRRVTHTHTHTHNKWMKGKKPPRLAVRVWSKQRTSLGCLLPSLHPQSPAPQDSHATPLPGLLSPQPLLLAKGLPPSCLLHQ